MFYVSVSCRDTTEEARIKKMVDAWINTLTEDIQVSTFTRIMELQEETRPAEERVSLNQRDFCSVGICVSVLIISEDQQFLMRRQLWLYSSTPEWQSLL